MKKTAISRKLMVLILTLAMVLPFSVFTASAAGSYEFWDLRNDDNIAVTELTGTINGEPSTILRYTGYYLPVSGRDGTDQRINIYVPSNAGPNSAIYHLVNNSGWSNNAFPANTIQDGFNFNYDINNNIAQAVARGMIVVSYGCRSRGQGEPGDYYGHSPATMADTKAALRYVRYNCEPGRLLNGLCNPEAAFVTGSSGGGALSVVLAASGNSPDYFPALYEIGAAGIELVGGDFVSTISDAYLGTVAYCPITDLPMADQAYEFTYNTSRTMRPDAANVNGNNVLPLSDNPVMRASNWLAWDFTSYINGLGLKDENGAVLTASYSPPADPSTTLNGATGGSFKDAMRRLLERGINKAIDEYNTGYSAKSNADAVDNLDAYSAWLQINGLTPVAGIPVQGSKATIIDLDQFLTTVPSSALKIAPAFDNAGLVNAGMQNENNLTGRADQRLSHWHEWSWNDADSSVVDVGFANTGISWDDFLQTNDGVLVALQAKMTTPIPYLLGAKNIPYLQYKTGSDVCDVAPYWYVRHGQADRDTSFAVGTLLYYSLLSNEAVDNDLLNFNFAWRKQHSGNYDILEAFDWVDAVLEEVGGLVVEVPVVSIFGPSSVTYTPGGTVKYVVSVKYAPMVTAVQLTLRVDDAYYTTLSLTSFSGFSSVGNLEWKDVGGGKWEGTIVLAGAANGDFDIFGIEFAMKGMLGSTKVELVDFKMAYEGNWVFFHEGNMHAVTDIITWHSTFDLNKDGVIDLRDISIAMMYFMWQFGDPNWASAKIADVNFDDIVDIADLILIRANFS